MRTERWFWAAMALTIATGAAPLVLRLWGAS
jgi:hypothetical protein